MGQPCEFQVQVGRHLALAGPAGAWRAAAGEREREERERERRKRERGK
jgi:hypothetical protein